MTYFERVFTAFLFILFAAACSPQVAAPTETPTANVSAPVATQQEEGGYQTLTVDQFADILENDAENYTIINVHIPYEGEIAGTDAHAAYNDVNALLSVLPDSDAPIILYCRSGRMSEIASQELIERGYTQVWDVPGGMNAWQQSGREVQMNAG